MPRINQKLPQRPIEKDGVLEALNKEIVPTVEKIRRALEDISDELGGLESDGPFVLSVADSGLPNGVVLTAGSNITLTLGAGVLTIAATTMYSPPVVEIPDATLTIDSSHFFKYLVFTNAAGCVVTLDAGVMSASDWILGRQKTVGQVAFTGTATIEPPVSFDAITAELGASFSLFAESSSEIDLAGHLELL